MVKEVDMMMILVIARSVWLEVLLVLFIV